MFFSGEFFFSGMITVTSTIPINNKGTKLFGKTKRMVIATTTSGSFKVNTFCNSPAIAMTLYKRENMIMKEKATNTAIRKRE